MAWEDDMLTMLRVLVNDQAETTYSESSLLKTLVVAAFQVNQELDFTYDFVVSISNETIQPDPTATATKDESFVNLTCLKAACLIDRGSAMVAANRAIAVRDGSSAIDLRGVIQSKLKLLEKGWCAVYEDAKFEYQKDQHSVAGAIVMTPFRMYAQGGYSPINILGGDQRDRNYYH